MFSQQYSVAKSIVNKGDGGGGDDDDLIFSLLLLALQMPVPSVCQNACTVTNSARRNSSVVTIAAVYPGGVDLWSMAG